MILLAAFWLPLGLFGRNQSSGLADGFRVAGLKNLASVSATQAPSDAVEFHQFRVSALPCWFWKRCGWDGFEFAAWSGAPAVGCAGTWSVAFAAGELFPTWRFRERAARQPRAPCLA